MTDFDLDEFVQQCRAILALPADSPDPATRELREHAAAIVAWRDGERTLTADELTEHGAAVLTITGAAVRSILERVSSIFQTGIDTTRRQQLRDAFSRDIEGRA